MSQLFVNNFSFEQALNPGYQPSRTVARFENELACAWLAVAEADDQILCSATISDADREALAERTGTRAELITPQQIPATKITQIIPWGWTPAVRKLASQLGVTISVPLQDAIRRVNSRQFSTEVSQQLGCALPGECVVNSLPELMPSIQRIHQQFGKWIIKPNLSQAGRGQLRGDSPYLSESQLATLLHLLSGNGVVVVEPLLDSVAELGWQWEIHSDGRQELHGIARLLTDEQGRYVGSHVNSIEIRTQQMENLECLHREVLQRIFSAGYFGPVGIDTMIYREGNTQRIRPLQEINARWTMGRLALAWGKRFHSSGKWLHSQVAPNQNSTLLSPDRLDGEQVGHRTWWRPDDSEAVS